MTSIPEEEIKQKLRADYINSLKLDIAEELPLPPKPSRRNFSAHGVFEYPTTPEGKVAVTIGSSVLLGAFIGATRAWFYDYKKIPNIQYMQSLRVNARYIKKPMFATIAMGTTWALVNYAMDKYNTEMVRPVNTEKEQSLTQDFWKATLAVASASAVTGNPSFTLPVAFGVGSVYLYYRYMNATGSSMQLVRKGQEERLRVNSNPMNYKPIDSLFKLNENRINYTFFYEDRMDKPPRRAEGYTDVEYVEE